jgi:hypothetical protein
MIKRIFYNYQANYICAYIYPYIYTAVLPLYNFMNKQSSKQSFNKLKTVWLCETNTLEFCVFPPR